MTKRPAIGWLCLCLLLSACATPGQQLTTPPAGVTLPTCPLVACLLPARPVVASNGELLTALDETEDALEACAVQVRECIQIQAAGRAAAQR